MQIKNVTEDVSVYTCQEYIDNWKKSTTVTRSLFNSIALTKPKFTKENAGQITRLKTNKAIHVKITKADRPAMLKTYRALYKSLPKPRRIHGFILKDISEQEILACIFNDIDAYKKYGVRYGELHNHFAFETGTTGAWEGEFILYKFADFEEVVSTKRELEWLEANAKHEKRAKFNSLVASDLLINELNKKELDYTIKLVNNRFLCCDKVRGWNKLIKDAVEYYLNNAVLPSIGCTMKMPKQTSAHKLCFKDPICDLGDVEIDFEKHKKERGL